jgi:hypothetical protein
MPSQEWEWRLKRLARVLERGIITQGEYDQAAGKSLHEWLKRRIDLNCLDEIGEYRDRVEPILVDARPGDELWEWDSISMGGLNGTQGFALVRDGEVIDAVELAKS